MDHGQHVLTHEHQHVARTERHLRLDGQREEARLPVVARCGTETFDGDAECFYVDAADQKIFSHEESARSSDWNTQRLKSFTFNRRPHYHHCEARRYSSNASPRSRHTALFLSSLPRIELPSNIRWNQDLEMNRNDRSGRRASSAVQPRHSQSWPGASAMTATHADFGVTPLLTPPEEVDQFTWTTCSQTTPSRQESLSSDIDNQTVVVPTRNSSDRSTERPSTITLPAQGMLQGAGGPSTWLSRAVQTIVSVHGDLHPNAHINMVAQAMPPYTERSLDGSKLLFEEVVQSLQQFATNVPYVTITHAYTDRTTVSLGEIPDSPPATPNTLGGSDYFDCNTIFTHGAQVPDYHKPNTAAGNTGRNPKVAAPSSVDVGTLERYLPPTTADEVRDFFSLSRRSHLVDRLSELAASKDGTLLLVYPTKAGGQTFAKWYKNPVMDPLLRQFMLLRGLTTPAADALGRLESVESLLPFEEMKAALEQLCSQLALELPPIGGRSAFSIAHAEQAEVILNRRSWVELFLAQEGSRMRQDLIDYQKSGQRMPSQGFEASPAALAREVEDGIRSSKEHAGGIGIEVGVFVIKRHLV